MKFAFIKENKVVGVMSTPDDIETIKQNNPELTVVESNTAELGLDYNPATGEFSGTPTPAFVPPVEPTPAE